MTNSCVPYQIIAGDTLEWTASYSDYPASAWTLTYYFRGLLGSFDITAAQVGATDSYIISEAIATTVNFVAGDYEWEAYVGDGSERFRVDCGKSVVTASLSTQSAGYDPRSDNEKILDSITAVLQGKASQDVLSYSINGRSLTKMGFEDLVKTQNHYKWLVELENRNKRFKQGKQTNAISYRFTR
jgi:hypothetical protein